MGYPTKRVAMTDVHGQPQQGGYLPAEIWHAYMSAVVEGKTCQQFSPAKESLSYQPFYGKFATTGQSRASASESQSEHPSVKRQPTHTNSPGGAGTGSPRAPETRPSAPAAPNSSPPTRETGGASPH
jgi:membrane carboxypeptidase/penicillin-binding protein